MNNECKSAYGTPTVLKMNKQTLLITPAGDVVDVENGKGLNSGIGRCSNPSPVVQDGIIYYGDNAVKAVKLNDKYKDEEIWSGEIKGDVFGSPIIHNGLVFIVSGNGELFAYDVNGKGSPDPVINCRNLYPDDAGGEPVVYANLALAGKHLFVSTLKGDTFVLEATKEAKVVGKNALPDPTSGSPIFSGNDIFIRSGENLFCIGQ
jgi:outer membrane protein assembly factor BamB